jgi:hypothetical protein
MSADPTTVTANGPPALPVCATCGHPVVFGPHDWDHRDDAGCADPIVAWPPPRSDDDTDDA